MRDPLLCGRAAFVYRVVGGRNRPHTYHASVDSTLLPAVMDQIVVKKRDFDRPPTLLPSLEKGGDNVVHSFNCPPPYGGLVSCRRTCWAL